MSGSILKRSARRSGSNTDIDVIVSARCLNTSGPAEIAPLNGKSRGETE